MALPSIAREQGGQLGVVNDVLSVGIGRTRCRVELALEESAAKCGR